MVVVDMARLSALAGGQGSLLELDLRVQPGVPTGSYRLDLEWASLNDGWLTLNPAPRPGADPTDGSLEVRSAFVAAGRGARASIVDAPVAATNGAEPAAATQVIDWTTGMGLGEDTRKSVARPWAVDFVAGAGAGCIQPDEGGASAPSRT
jgi:hypothetical protein